MAYAMTFNKGSASPPILMSRTLFDQHLPMSNAKSAKERSARRNKLLYVGDATRLVTRRESFHLTRIKAGLQIYSQRQRTHNSFLHH